MYKGHSWRFIEEHIHDTLGRSYRELGDLQSAVHHFMAILPCPQATTALQGRYLQQFLDAVHQAGAAQVGVMRGLSVACEGSLLGVMNGCSGDCYWVSRESSRGRRWGLLQEHQGS